MSFKKNETGKVNIKRRKNVSTSEESVHNLNFQYLKAVFKEGRKSSKDLTQDLKDSPSPEVPSLCQRLGLSGSVSKGHS